MNRVQTETTDFLKYLETTLIKYVLPIQNRRQIVMINGDATVDEALGSLSENNILSAPVIDDDNNFLGLVDVLDILAFSLETYTRTALPVRTEENTSQNWRNWRDETTATSVFSTTSVRNILNKSKVNVVRTVNEHTTLYQLIQLLFRNSVHRAIVVNNQNEFGGLISQSDVIALVSAKMELLGSLGKKTVGELNLGTKSVITMSVHSQMIHAYWNMAFHKVSAVAIIDSSGKLVANLSASDIRGIKQGNYPALLANISEYFSFKKKGMLKAPITCSLGTSLETLLLLISMFRVHRVWIVNDKSEPIGVISLTDVMILFGDLG